MVKNLSHIDGLRAISIIAVILYHYNLFNLDNGLFGVDIFFVISGYLISSIIFNEIKVSGNFNFKYFYERRFRRLVPPLIFLSIIIVPISVSIFEPFTILSILKSSFFSVFFFSNFFFHYNSIGYFSEIGNIQPLLHTWSLSVEAQYYLIFPLCIFLIYKLKISKYLLPIIIIVFLISFIFSEIINQNHPSFNFYMITSRAWEILAGSIIAYCEIFKNFKILSKKLNIILPKVGIIFIFYTFFFLNNELNGPNINTFIPVIGTLAIIISRNQNEIILKILSSKFFVGIGLISYSLYLWHYPLITIFKFKFFYIQNIEIICLLLSGVFSVISYYFVEKNSRDKHKDFKKIFLSSLIPLSILIVISFYNLNLIETNKKNQFINIHPYLNIEKFKKDHINFKVNYNYDNFKNDKKNVFIVGNSYSDDLLNIFHYNKSLSKNYYFYTASNKYPNDDNFAYYQINCFYEFLQSNLVETKCNNNDFSSHLIKQYRKSDIIILYQKKTDSKYLNLIKKINKILLNDHKKLIVLLNNSRLPFFSSFNKLDTFVYHKKRYPNDIELRNFEEEVFKYSEEKFSKIISFVKKDLINLKIKFYTSKDLFCNVKERRCPLITDQNNKIYEDYGHMTDKGAKFFAKRLDIIFREF